jgi:hypothetical protein
MCEIYQSQYTSAFPVFFLKCLLCIWILSLSRDYSYAQTVNVTVKLDSLKWHGIADPNGSAEPRFNFTSGGKKLTYSCYQLTGAKGTHKFEAKTGLLLPLPVKWNNPAFYLVLDCFEKDKQNSDECYFNDNGLDNDDYHEKDSLKIDLTSLVSPIGQQLPPGVYSTTHFVQTNGKRYSAYLRVLYWVSEPPTQPIQTSHQVSDICAQENVTLKTTVNLPYKPGLTYVWEYHRAGEGTWTEDPYLQNCLDDCYYLGAANPYNSYDCSYCDENYPPVFTETWIPLGTTQTETITFNPYQKIFGSKLTEKTSIEFRVKIKTTEKESDWSTLQSYSFSPPPPDINNATITYDNACPGQPSGSIYISGISGVGQYIYVLRQGHNNTQTCDPEKDCLNNSYSGKAYGNSFKIEGVESGKYTLWITNPAGKFGTCHSFRNVYVPEHPRLELYEPLVKQIDCHGSLAGSITAHSGGGVSPVTYLLSGGTLPETLKYTLTTPGESTAFSGLGAGSYTLTVTDGCGQLQTRQIQIVQPAKLSARSPVITPATCTDPGNGEATINIFPTSGPFDINPSGNYVYQLYKDGSPFADAQYTSATEWQANNLPVSDQYELRVKNGTGQDCNGVTISFRIEGPLALSLDTLIVSPVSCFGGTNGEIVAARQNSFDQSFRYLLKKEGVAIDENTSGLFSRLSAGNYTVTKMRAITGCHDAYTSGSITITQPPAFSMSYTKTDISCSGQGDGKIEAAVSGGTAPYRYQWQLLTGKDPGLEEDWADMAGQVYATINRLEPGTYRLQVKDQHNCFVNPPNVTITEPALLEISGVKLQDIICLGGKAYLEPVVKGGTSPYTFYYSAAEEEYTSFTATTTFEPGNYRIKVIDRNRCQASYAQTISVTAPETALTFNYRLSDHNGYNISCHGGNNGSATIQASGGNGSSYAGYQYALDNGVYQASSLLTGITAGAHTLYVKDARGCVESKTVFFTEPTATLSVELTGKTDIICYGGKEGQIEVKVQGGTSPYLFSLNGGLFQTQPRFANLGAGAYTVTVKDVNGCASSLPVSILHLQEPIQLRAVIRNVSCFGGNDGKIEVSVNGGAGEYQYLWKDLPATRALAEDLPAGTYSLQIVDASGCRRDTSFTIRQPESPLSVYVHNTPVCAGRSNGVIRLSPRGGTPPYLYSIDNGASFQATEWFAVGTGNYPIVVKDNKGCVSYTGSTIVARNDKPEPNFLVATSQSAFDTLVIKETSLPKPDSIHWTFDAHAILLDTDQWSPRIRFLQPGSYVINMKGFFGGCDYSITKTLTLSAHDPAAVPVSGPGSSAIRELSVTPNPNDGNFSFTVKLSGLQALSVVIVDVLGNEYYRRHWSGVTEVTQNVKISMASSGFYILKAIVPTDARETRVLLHKQ